MVKVNRTIILTVNRFSLPLVDMPALEGKTLNFAIEILKRSHLKFGDTIFRPDFMMGSVIEQQYHGDKISSGSKVPWGSVINLVVGSGLNSEPMLVPEFIGMTYEQVKDSLDKMGVTLGALVTDPDVTDTNMAFIWKQQPPTKNEDDGQYDFGSDIINRIFNRLSETHKQTLLTLYSEKDGVKNYNMLRSSLEDLLEKEIKSYLN